MYIIFVYNKYMHIVYPWMIHGIWASTCVGWCTHLWKHAENSAWHLDICHHPLTVHFAVESHIKRGFFLFLSIFLILTIMTMKSQWSYYLFVLQFQVCPECLFLHAWRESKNTSPFLLGKLSSCQNHLHTSPHSSVHLGYFCERLLTQGGGF